MALDPLGRSSTPTRPDQLRTESSARAEGSASSTRATEGGDTVLAADVLSISAEALESSRAEGIPTGVVSSDQLRDIRQRLADGAYHTPTVTEAISEEVLREIQLPIAWGGLA